MKGEGCVLAWQHCLTHICQGHCNYLAEATVHRKNVIRTKIVPSCPQLPGQRFLDKSRSAVWLEELAPSCLGLSKISCKYPFDLVCSWCKLLIILVKVSFIYSMKCLDMKSGLFTCLRCHFWMCFRNLYSILKTNPVWQRLLEYKSVRRWKEYLFIWGLKGSDVKLEGEQKLGCCEACVQSWFNSPESQELWSPLLTITAKNCSVSTGVWFFWSKLKLPDTIKDSSLKIKVESLLSQLSRLSRGEFRRC